MTPSEVTWCSAIASSIADWVLGVARLISSTSTTLAKSGPGWKTNERRSWSKIESPVASVGWRSGVHWIRENSMPSTLAAIARARIVFAVPGTSSSSTWPPATSADEHQPDLLALAVDDRLEVVDQAPPDPDDGVQSAFARLHLGL